MKQKKTKPKGALATTPAPAPAAPIPVVRVMSDYLSIPAIPGGIVILNKAHVKAVHVVPAAAVVSAPGIPDQVGAKVTIDVFLVDDRNYRFTLGAAEALVWLSNVFSVSPEFAVSQIGSLAPALAGKGN